MKFDEAKKIFDNIIFGKPIKHGMKYVIKTN